MDSNWCESVKTRVRLVKYTCISLLNWPQDCSCYISWFDYSLLIIIFLVGGGYLLFCNTSCTTKWLAAIVQFTESSAASNLTAFEGPVFVNSKLFRVLYSFPFSASRKFKSHPLRVSIISNVLSLWPCL